MKLSMPQQQASWVHCSNDNFGTVVLRRRIWSRFKKQRNRDSVFECCAEALSSRPLSRLSPWSATAIVRLGDPGKFPRCPADRSPLNNFWSVGGVEEREWKNLLLNLRSFERRQVIVLAWRDLYPIGRRERCSNGSQNGYKRWFRKSRRRSPRERSRVVAGNDRPVTNSTGWRVRRPHDLRVASRA